MGSSQSKYLDENIELKEGLKLDWVKELSKEHLAILARLQLEYIGRFRYGLAGHNYSYVEIHAYDDLMEQIFEILPWEYTKKQGLLDSRAQIQKNGLYYKREILEITTVLLERSEAKEFFSIFKNIQPKLEQMWIHLTQNEGTFQTFDEDSIEKMFYEGSERDRQGFRRTKIQEFLEGDLQRYSTRRVSVIFGYDKREMPYHMKLVYYHNARGLGNGYLRLHFTYKTFENGKVTHMMPWQIYQEKKNKKMVSGQEGQIVVDENHFESDKKKKKKILPEEEKEEDPALVELDMERIRETKERHKKRFLPSGKLTPEYEEELIASVEQIFRKKNN